MTTENFRQQVSALELERQILGKSLNVTSPDGESWLTAVVRKIRVTPTRRMKNQPFRFYDSEEVARINSRILRDFNYE